MSGVEIMDQDVARVRSILEHTPGVLRAMLGGMDEGLTRAPYGPGTWSAHEVVAHLIHGERTDWLPRARWILEHGEARAFEPFNRAGHAALAAAHGTGELLDLFERERGEGLSGLDGLGLRAADLARRGRHPALGVVTLGNLLATWAVHDLNHIAQIAKAVAYRFKDEVGPWEAYLSVLSPPNAR